MATKEQNVLTNQWLQAKTAAAAAIEMERSLRAQMVGSFFPNFATLERGTHNFDLGNGYTLKYVKKVQFDVAKDVDVVDNMLDRLAKSGNSGAFQAERIVKWSAELSLSAYKELTATEKAIVDSVVTTKDATPSLELSEPKGGGIPKF